MTGVAQTAWSHLRRYPKWYAVAVVWLLAMALVPVVTQPTARVARRTPAPAAVLAAPPPVAPAPAAAVALPALPSAPPILPGLPIPVPGPIRQPTATPPAQPADPPLIQLPALPALPLPAAPAELEPVFNALSPLMVTGCSGIGLAALVVAVVAPTVEDVPLAQLMPYLVPVYSLCAYFPIPETHTICPLDDQIAAQLSDDITSLLPAPTVIGLGIDEIAGMEAATFQMFGYEIPSLAANLREQLGCRVE